MPRSVFPPSWAWLRDVPTSLPPFEEFRITQSPSSGKVRVDHPDGSRSIYEIGFYRDSNQCGEESVIKISATVTHLEMIDCVLTPNSSFNIRFSIPSGATESGPTPWWVVEGQLGILGTMLIALYRQAEPLS